MRHRPAFTSAGTARGAGGATLPLSRTMDDRTMDGRTMDEWNKSRPAQPEHVDFHQVAAERERKRREREEKRKKSLDDRLERGLEESFPGSDPVAVTQPPASIHDKPRR